MPLGYLILGAASGPSAGAQSRIAFISGGVHKGGPLANLA